jgi:hypothetical protein
MNHSANSPLNVYRIYRKLDHKRGMMFGFLIIGALLAFELFNYSTTDYALNDFLGGLTFLGVRWATILAIAFCGIDFAGIARLFTPEQGENNGPREVWYLFAAWLLAASMNAMLTWWGVALAIVNHQSLGGTIIPRQTLIDIVPIFVAIMVWVIRVLIIGTFSIAGNRLFSQADGPQHIQSVPVMHRAEPSSRSAPAQSLSLRPMLKSSPETDHRPANRPEPTYHPASLSGYKPSNNQTRQ